MKNTTISALRRERERRGWSRNYIAEQVEVDVITVGRWEREEQNAPSLPSTKVMCPL